MKLKIQFDTTRDRAFAVRVIDRLIMDLDLRLKPGKKWDLRGDDGKYVGMARVVREPRTTADQAASIMQPVIDGTRQRGSIPRLRETFERMTGEQFHGATWFRWLSLDAESRMEPAIGTALAIAAAFERIQQEDADAEANRQAKKASEL